MLRSNRDRALLLGRGHLHNIRVSDVADHIVLICKRLVQKGLGAWIRLIVYRKLDLGGLVKLV